MAVDSRLRLNRLFRFSNLFRRASIVAWAKISDILWVFTLVLKRRKGPLDIPLYGMGLRCLAIGFGDGEEARGFEPELALLWILFSTEVLLPNPMTLKGFYP